MKKKNSYITGDEFKFIHSNRTIKLKPGLFIYSGFGMGEYYSSDGFKYWCLTSEARAQAEKENVKYDSQDSLEGYKATYLGD